MAGIVYPKGTKTKDFLACYSELFSTVELNFSYHAMPKADNLAKMLIDGGPKLRFSIKAHRTLTNEINPNLWEGEAKTYLTAIEPLIEAGRLDAVLFKFPYSFQYSPDNRKYLDRVLKTFKDVPTAVEFRKSDWYTGKVIEGMKSRNVPLVSLDMPDLPKLPPQMEVVTAPIAYIRMHGRNRDEWWGNDDHKRYDYLYTDSEIKAFVCRIQLIAEQAQRVLVYFNNHPKGKAVRNAQTLEKMLKKMGVIA